MLLIANSSNTLTLWLVSLEYALVGSGPSPADAKLERKALTMNHFLSTADNTFDRSEKQDI